METSIPLILSAIIGLLTGVIGSLVAPWVSWGIEKRKFKRKVRIELLQNLRNYLVKDNVQDKNFLNSEMYVRIRPFLTSELITDIENQSLVYEKIENSLYGPYNSRFLQELNQIESRWGLGIGKGRNREMSLHNEILGRPTVIRKRVDSETTESLNKRLNGFRIRMRKTIKLFWQREYSH